MTIRFPLILQFLPLVLLLSVASSIIMAAEIPGFWSIDCGGNGFLAENGLTWVSDESFVKTGVSGKGQDGNNLRSFPSKKIKKNCYTIPVGKAVKILIWLEFYYENYDGLESPPEMELIFDGHNSGTFQTTTEGGDWMEVIYVTKRKNTSICLGRTKNSDQDPFVTTIAVRRLSLNMYNGVDENKVLMKLKRDAFGANDWIKYPDDRYDRWWYPRSEGFTVLRSDTNLTVANSLPDDPPALLSRTAVGPSNISSSTLSITLSELPTYPVDIYYNIYFSEMSKTTSFGSRAFSTFIGGINRSSGAIIPPYQSIDQYSYSKLEASSSTTFEFVNTGNATLPPIISGMEIFLIEPAADLTHENDVVALGILQERFEVLQEWTGDPCLPEDYNWEWVGCHLYTTASRVSKLNLAGFGLSGRLPDFSNLDQLVTIDLHNNSLSGPIPEFLNNFPSLTTLNLADNKFTSIPTSLSENKRIKLNISGNPINSITPSKNSGQKAKVPDQLLIFNILMFLPVIFLIT